MDRPGPTRSSEGGTEGGVIGVRNPGFDTESLVCWLPERSGLWNWSFGKEMPSIVSPS